MSPVPWAGGRTTIEKCLARSEDPAKAGGGFIIKPDRSLKLIHNGVSSVDALSHPGDGLTGA
jgi:hypothetical protein